MLLSLAKDTNPEDKGGGEKISTQCPGLLSALITFSPVLIDLNPHSPMARLAHNPEQKGGALSLWSVGWEWAQEPG